MKKNVVIVFLILIIVSLTSYIVYDKLIINEKTGESKNEANHIENDAKKEETTSKYDLSNTLYSDVNEDNFSYVAISKFDQELGVDTDEKIITRYSEVEEIIYNLATTKHEKEETTGIGMSNSYTVRVVYFVNNEEKVITTTDTLLIKNLETYTNSYNEKTLSLLSNLYNRY